MFRAGGVRRDERQGNRRSGHAGKLDFRFFSRFFESLHRHSVVAKVNALFFLEFISQPVDDSLVEIVAAQTVVTGSCQNFLNAVAHFDDRNIECAAAEVVNHDFLVVFFINAVSKRSRCRLVDNTFDVETSDTAGVFGRLTLCVGEVSGNGDDRFGHFAAEVAFRVAFQLLQNHCGNFLRGVSFVADGDFVIRTHVAFNRRNGALGVGDGLAFCDLTDHTLAVFGKRDNGRGGSCAFGVRNNDGLAAFDNRDAGVCCT